MQDYIDNIDYEGSTWNSRIYQYYKEHGGYLVGSVEEKDGTECILILDQDTIPLVLSVKVKVSNGYNVHLTGTARMMADLANPYQLDIEQADLIHKGINLFARTRILMGEKDLDQKYIIRSNQTEFTRMYLPHSALAQELSHVKGFQIRVRPIAGQEKMHNVEVTCNKGLVNSVIQAAFNQEDLEQMVHLCRIVYRAVTEYPVPEVAR